MGFERLIRFADSSGQIHYGELPRENLSKIIGTQVSVLKGDVYSDMSPTGEKKRVEKLLSPLTHVPIFHGIGLNYKAHAAEANLKTSTYPVCFNKPSGALAGPYEDIPIHKEAKELDYEGELCVVIGRDAFNVSEGDALKYVLGYTAGNDISARFHQRAENSGGPPGYAKSFDKFAPIGPTLVSANTIPDPTKLRLTTRVNGEKRQETGTDDLIFDIPQIIAHLSRGRTLQKGSVIMTGTPQWSSLVFP